MDVSTENRNHILAVSEHWDVRVLLARVVGGKMAHQHSAVMTGTHKYPGISILCLRPLSFLPCFSPLGKHTHTHLYFCHTVNVLQCAVTAAWPWLLIKFLSELCFCASTGLLGRPQIRPQTYLSALYQYFSACIPLFYMALYNTHFDWSTALPSSLIFPNIHCC